MPETLGADDAEYALEIVRTICAQVGPGLPGTPQERARAAILQRELESHLGASQVIAEEFILAPAAFLSAFPLSAGFLLAAALFNLASGHLTGVASRYTATVAQVFASLAPLAFILLFVRNLELLDPFLERKQSVNVVGRLCKPETRAVKRLLIVSGHHDSAPENTWIGLLGHLQRRLVRSGRVAQAKVDPRRILGWIFYLVQATPLLAYGAMLVMSVIQWMGIMTDRVGLIRLGTLGWVPLAYPILLAVAYGLFFNRPSKAGGTVPGAADNLSACGIAVALCRFLVQHPEHIPADTEIRFITFGSEEAGLRGSRRYVERHLRELNLLDARLLNVETVAHPEIVILSSEASGTVQNSPEMVACVAAAAERAGVQYQVRPAFLGVANDAASFSQAGLKATTLLCFKVPEQLVEFYHQPWDRPEVLTIEPLLNVLKLTLEWIRGGGE